MPTDVNRFYANPIEGSRRSTGFGTFAPYSNVGPLSIETSISQNHSRLNGRWSGGGPWTLTRDTTTYSHPSRYHQWGSPPGNLGSGTIRINSPTTGITSLSIPAAPNDLTLNAMGTTAIARTEPTNPAFDLSVFLGELRAEGLPNLPGSTVRDKVGIARSSGSEYLNVEFGWSPLVRGVRDFCRVVSDSDHILNSYRSHANKVIDRSYQWPEETDWQWDSCNFTVDPAIGFYTGGGRLQHTWKRTWFEVEYLYHIPVGMSAGDKFSRYGSYARKLLGIDLSPEVLWNLSPWSWAADWFGNVGDVMHNISALGTDGLVLRNGYIMCHSGRMTKDSGMFASVSMEYKTRLQESKLRRSATPYGFGVSFSSLSAKQIAVISALGLSRW